MTTLPVLPQRSAGLRPGLVLLAIALTATAGVLGRPASEQVPSDEVFRPGTITSFEAAAAR